MNCGHALLQMCRLLRHVSGTEPLEITCIHAEETFQVTGQQVRTWQAILSIGVLFDYVTDGEEASRRVYFSEPRL